ncbi:Riboflavin transporter MCH5 [Pleurostoma richardsiae]|uniref:Riboflavin transporter MCH5 n=1 Tax=Pleurostoma richardsiae TaxID=41990 RepID=A0AA38VBR4_9PEZI|nr:Riboflavin transporter MCH5 [Pleurostoma richardsiae]
MADHSSSSTDLDLSSDIEKGSRDAFSARDDQGAFGSVRNRGEDDICRHTTRNSNTQPVPGMTEKAEDAVDEESSEDGESTAEQRGRLSAIVTRALSRTTSRSSWNPGPPPDGGLQAWTAVLCVHLVIMNTWGYINSFGVFQTYYTSALSLPPSTISWIGSVQVFLLFFIGTFTGRLTDAGYFREVFFLGSAFQILGIFATSACTEYWQFFLAQGVCMGLGNGCLFCPAMATVSTYFSTRRSLAIGLAACGSVTGGLVYPSMVRQLLPSVGFPWTIRAMGFIQLAGLVVSNVFLKTRIPPRRSGAIVDWAAFKDLDYTFYAAGSFFCFMGVYFAFYYVASFSRDIIGMTYTDSLNLLLVLNGVGAVGRIVPNHYADRLGAINVFVPVALVAGVCQLAWIAVDSPAGLYVWACFYGIAAGGIQSLFPAGLSSLTTDLRRAGVRMGMVFTINSFATLTGPPVAGAIISATEGGRYYGAQAFAGCVLLVGTGFMAAARVAKTRRVGGGWRARV